jgi:DNA recombination protein RmuC
MNVWLIIGLIVASSVVGVLILYIFLRRGKSIETSGQAMLIMQNQLNEMARKLDQSLGESNKLIQSQHGESIKHIKEMTGELIKVGEGHKQVMDITGQLKNLEDILKNPKQRGVLGEYYLENVLKNVLPPNSYQMQYGFKDGTIVDAVVFVKDKIIPVDSKFSLDNYNRLAEVKDPTEKERLEKVFKADLKLRIDETAKYVKPAEGTVEFAFMFIPHEAIYYDLLVAQVGAVKVNTRDLIEYAFKEKRVIIVSPTSFLAYLQTVLQGLKALQIEESAKEIRKHVESLEKHLLSYDEYLKRVGKNLGTTVSAYNGAQKEFKKIDKDITRITGGGMDNEIELLQKPESEEEE